MGSPALAFVAGLGGGYMAQQQRNKENDREDARLRMQQETHDLQQRSAQRDEDLRLSLAAAGKPAQVDVGAGGVTKPDYADNIDVGQPGEPGGEGGPTLQQGMLVNGTPYSNSGDAAAAAGAYNDPNAVSLRQVQAYQSAGKPVDAMNLQKGAFTLNKDQQEYARKLKDENAFDTARALRTGDPQQIKEAFNKGGQWKIIGEPVVVPKKRTDIPGLPEVTTYDTTVTLQGPDGQQQSKTINSHDFSMAMMPYEKGLDLQQKGQRNEDRAEFQGQLADVRDKLANVADKVATQKLADADNRSKVTLTEAERKRWTAAMNAASANLRTAEKAAQAFQSDRLNARAITKNPTGPEAMQFKQLQDAVTKHTTDYNEARARLAGSVGGSPGTASSGAQPVPASKGDLKAGTVYQTSRGPATWNGTAFEQ